MKKQLFTSLFLMLTAFGVQGEMSLAKSNEAAVVATQDIDNSIYLEGISMLGSKRNAYVVINGGQLTVSEGDKVGEWVVEHIERRLIILKNADGETAELQLHNRLEQNTDEMNNEATTSNSYTLPTVPDDQIPAGYRKVRTPFGEFLVKNEGGQPMPPPATPVSPESEKRRPVPTDGIIPDGFQRVDTPFGSFMMEQPPKPAANVLTQ